MSKREHRVTIALKWHYLDNMTPAEIRDRFDREGIGDYTVSTIRDYLNEDPKDAVLEAIEDEHANVRLQIAEREEQKHQRAREAEAEATEDRAIKRVVPATAQVSTDRDYPLTWPDWVSVDADDPDYPEWASDRDVIIRFTDGTCQIQPGEQYPLQAIDGSPKYTTEFAGLERDLPDQQARSSLRREQSQHLQAKGDVLGVYSTDINMNVDGELDTTVSLDETTAAAIREADLRDQEESDE